MGWFSKALSFAKNNVSGLVHGVLDVAGFILGVGAVASKGVKAAKLASKAEKAGSALDKAKDALQIVRKGKTTTGASLLKKIDIQKAIEDIKSSFKKELPGGMEKVKTAGTKVKNKIKEFFCKGDPVDIVTGVVFNEYIDIEFPGSIPFQWIRRYYSDNRRAGVLGHRIVLNYETEITDGDRRLSFLLPSGQIIKVEADVEESISRAERFKLSKRDGGFEVYFYEEQLTYTYERVKQGQTVYSLTAIRDKAGHQISFSYERDGLSGITDSAGRRISIQTDAGGRVTKVTAGKRDLVSYTYSAEGDLVSVQDTAGEASKYKYDNHLLIQSKNRDGHSFYWEYDSTRYDAKCIHT